MKKKQRCFVKRFAALVAALMLCASLCVPAFAAGNNWPSSPSSNDFLSHPYSWYVWQEKSLLGVSGYELICRPMQEYNSSNTSYYSIFSYSTSSNTYSYISGDGTTHTLMYAFPFIPFSSSTGYWSDFPSFPIGSPTRHTGAVRIYPVIWKNYLSSVSDVFTDRSVFGFLTSWPSNLSGSLSDYYSHEVVNEFPIYVPSNIFFFGSKTDTSTNHTSFGIVNGDNDFWSTPSNEKFLEIILSHYGRFHSFPSNFSIPSSDVGFVFCKKPSSDGMHVYNSEFNVELSFTATLWVPSDLLPADVMVGDWISKPDVEGLQDQLTKDFNIDSDTLKNSKDNLNSWNSTPSVDSDVASGAFGLLNGIFQNLGTFLFSVSLLCFGAVVLRMLIRKAVDG